MFKWERQSRKHFAEQKHLKAQAEQDSKIEETLPEPEDGKEAKAYGVSAFQSGNFEIAARYFQKALDFGDIDDVAGLHSNRSAALLRAGLPKEAVEEANLIIQLRPDWSKGFFRRGEAYSALQNFHEALQDFEGARELQGSPSDPVLEGKITSTQEAVQQQSALAKLQEEMRAAELAADDREREPRVKELMQEAQALFAQADLQAAATCLKQALKLEPSYFQAASQLGMLLHHLGREEEALHYFKLSITYEKGFMSGYVMTGGMLETLGRLAEAENIYRKGLRTFFDDSGCWVACAAVLIKQGKLQEGIELLREARQGGPEGKFHKPAADPQLNFLLGYMLHLKGYLSEPTALYLRVCSEGAQLPWMYVLARAQHASRDCAPAEAIVRRMADLRRTDRPHFLRELSILNWTMDLPQWDVLGNKVQAALHRSADPTYRSPR
ncbi:hypothetical protein CYMTET_35988 [Cymbomonas tetramitiformis]|uniref:Uncharacterized protein n=1 Tax=Cymbomonas tetramitiformis TaxID=36881 RepID=A0AAE0F848_9CHLO|nr:hypothetical protein CYMTET_35988 [Cymbomonas tetramitiformis]